MIMDCPACQSNLTAYLDQELSTADAEEIRTHLDSCRGCAAEFQSLSEAAWMIGEAIQPVDLPGSLWSGIAAAIEPPAPQPRRSLGAFLWEFLNGNPYRGFAAATAALVLLTASSLVLWQPARTHVQRTEMEKQFETMIQRMDSQEKQPHGLSTQVENSSSENPFSVDRAVPENKIAGTSTPAAKKPPAIQSAPVLSPAAPLVDASDTELRQSR